MPPRDSDLRRLPPDDEQLLAAHGHASAVASAPAPALHAYMYATPRAPPRASNSSCPTRSTVLLLLGPYFTAFVALPIPVSSCLLFFSGAAHPTTLRRPTAPSCRRPSPNQQLLPPFRLRRHAVPAVCLQRTATLAPPPPRQRQLSTLTRPRAARHRARGPFLIPPCGLASTCPRVECPAQPAPIPGIRGFCLQCAPRLGFLGAAPRRSSCCLTYFYSYSWGGALAATLLVVGGVTT